MKKLVVLPVLGGLVLAMIAWIVATSDIVRAEDLIVPDSYLGDAGVFTGSPPSHISLPVGWRYCHLASEVPAEAVAYAAGFLRRAKLGDFEDHGLWGIVKNWHFDDNRNPAKSPSWYIAATVVLNLAPNLSWT